MRARGLLVFLALGLTGCAMGREDFIQLNEGTVFPARAARAPVTMTVGDLDRPYREVGVIHVSGLTRNGYEQLNDKMRAKARESGADAIIYVRYGTENAGSVIPFFVALPYDVLIAEGLAVKSEDAATAQAPQEEPSS